MRHKLIDWIDAKGRIWGIAQRRLDLKSEGWPESVFGRIQDGEAPSTFSLQRFPEGMTGDALEFRCLLPVLTYRQHAHVYVHYVVPVTVKEKIDRMGRSRENYYKTLSDAHRKLANASRGLTQSTYLESTV